VNSPLPRVRGRIWSSRMLQRKGIISALHPPPLRAGSLRRTRLFAYHILAMTDSGPILAIGRVGVHRRVQRYERSGDGAADPITNRPCKLDSARDCPHRSRREFRCLKLPTAPVAYRQLGRLPAAYPISYSKSIWAAQIKGGPERSLIAQVMRLDPTSSASAQSRLRALIAGCNGQPRSRVKRQSCDFRLTSRRLGLGSPN
jgi:hypothetical protein